MIAHRLIPERIGDIAAIVTTGGQRFEYRPLEPRKWAYVKVYEVKP